MKLIETAVVSCASLDRMCVLGAGNLNDLEVACALKFVPELHLVDIDAEAVISGLARQGRLGDPRIVLHTGVDITTGDWAPSTFSIVVSASILSQLLIEAASATSVKGPALLADVLSTRDQHLELLIRLGGIGGVVILLLDIVSSDTVPRLAARRGAFTEKEVADLIAEKNFFSGCNPYVIANRFASYGRVRSVQVTCPWIWSLGPERCYVSVALMVGLDTMPRREPAQLDRWSEF